MELFTALERLSSTPGSGASSPSASGSDEPSSLAFGDQVVLKNPVFPYAQYIFYMFNNIGTLSNPSSGITI
jgi:hypothetical protein